MKRPSYVLVLLLGLLLAYIGARLLPWWPWPVQLLIGAVLAFIGVAIGQAPKTWRSHHLLWSWLSGLSMGALSWLLVLTLIRDVALGAYHLLVAPASAAVLAHSAQAVVVLATVLTLISVWLARRIAPVVDVDIPLAHLPPELEGFTIVQLSDIHVGPTIKQAYLQAIVERVNALTPDVVAITGDLVDGSVQQLAAHTAPLADLQARYGRFVVMGNHEYYSGALAWIEELRRLGLTVLLNEHVAVEHQGQWLTVAGITDYTAHIFHPDHRSDPHAAVAGAPAGSVKVLLAHQPRSAPEALAAGFDVQLSGHTHGGQFWPWNYFVPLQQPFVAGLNKLANLWVYTSRGTGYWGPPLRFAAPSEITRIRLRRLS